jgi:hypothetical protein
MTNINAFSSLATVEIKDGRTITKFSIEEFINAVAKKVLEQQEVQELKDKEPHYDNLSLDLGSVMARNVAKATKLARMTKSHSDNWQAEELIQEARLKVKLGKDLASPELAETIYEQSQEMITDIQSAYEAYKNTETILNRNLVQKIWNRGNNAVDFEAHADVYSDLIESQINLRTLWKENGVSPEIQNELLTQVPSGANLVFENYRKSLT